MSVCIQNTAKNAELSDSVFEDLHLSSLLPYKTVELLSRPFPELALPARIRTIQRRQEIFRFLLSEEGHRIMRDCYGTLKEYARDLSLKKAASLEAERRFLFRAVLDGYLRVCDALAGLNIPALAELAAYWKQKAGALASLREDLKTADRYLSVLGAWNLSLHKEAGSFMTKDVLKKKPFSKRYQDAAESLGMPLNETKASRVRLNDSLAHAVEELFPEETAALDALYANYTEIDFEEPCAYIEEFDFLFSVEALIRKAEEKGIPVCYPTPAETRQYRAKDVYDVTLFIKDAEHIVPNDTYFDGDTPFYFLTGANGGGKTTYLRAVCLNLVLFLFGCPVFAKEAEIYPFLRVLSHFPADERFSSSGRLVEEQARVSAMLEKTDADTFLVFNETFSGTDDKRGAELTLATSNAIREKHATGLFVTHFHEVREGGFPILNTVIASEDGNRRTFRVVKDLGMNSSFALDILKKYKLDAASLAERGF
ncbi:MAG: hypothetical protein MJ175_00615 [Clostridia bacterium]|nr:hypothetical protein [Clostridia bacterium]